MWKMVLLGVGVVFFIIVIVGIFFGGDEETESDETAKATGIGVSRDAVEDAFDDFDFDDSPLNDGRERLLGDSPSEAVTLQLIGDDSNLEEAALVITLGSSERSSDALAYSDLLLSTVLPDWTGGMDWFEQSVIQLADSGEPNPETGTRHGDVAITLTANKQFGWLTLAIKPAQGEPQAQVNPLSSDDSSEVQAETPGPVSPTEPVQAEVARPAPTSAPAQQRGQQSVNSATIAAASDATHVAESTRRANPQPQPTPTEDLMNPQVRLGPRNLLVGALGNGGIVSGKYEYQDATGNKVVQGDSCYMKINLGSPAQETIQAKKGEPFIYYIQDKHGYVILEGYDGGCTGDPAIGYGLYRIGGLAD